MDGQLMCHTLAATFFKPFVSNRIGESQMYTEPQEWRHVPGKLNVADEATRYEFKEEEIISDRWKHGPSFLYQEEEQWPKDPAPERVTEELRPKWDFIAFATNVQKDFPAFPVERLGNYNKAERIAAWAVHFVRRFVMKATIKQGLEAMDLDLGIIFLI